MNALRVTVIGKIPRTIEKNSIDLGCLEDYVHGICRWKPRACNGLDGPYTTHKSDNTIWQRTYDSGTGKTEHTFFHFRITNGITTTLSSAIWEGHYHHCSIIDNCNPSQLISFFMLFNKGVRHVRKHGAMFANTLYYLTKAFVMYANMGLVSTANIRQASYSFHQLGTAM